MLNEPTIATEPLRVLIVDDEAPARALLREYLAEHHQIVVVGECCNGFEAVKAVSDHTPDLLFLDIQMPKLDGFEVLELLGDERPAVIFVTAYDEHALRAFEVHALDYLLKPVEQSRLAEALGRLGPRPMPTSSAAVSQLLRGRHRWPAADQYCASNRVLVREGDQIHVLASANIDYVEAQDDHILLVAGKTRLRKQQTLSELASQLDPRVFVRIHRSYLLQVDRLAGLERYAKDSRVALLRDGTRLPISRAGYTRLRELL